MIDSVIPIPSITTIELTLLAKFGADNDAGLQKLYIDYCEATEQEPIWEPIPCSALGEMGRSFVDFTNYLHQVSPQEPEFVAAMFEKIANEKLRGLPRLN